MLARSSLMLAVGLLACAMTFGTAQADVAGTYSCRGSNPNGTPYVGSVVITKNGAGYSLNWRFGSTGHSGTGIFSNGQLSASFGVAGGRYGVVVYRRANDGRLIGNWINPSGGSFGSETLTPR